MPSGPITVVSNTSPRRYLIAVGRLDLIQKIFSQILIPRGVEEELVHPAAPAATRQWMTEKPSWLEVRDLLHDPELDLVRQLDQGECEAIQLARMCTLTFFSSTSVAAAKWPPREALLSSGFSESSLSRAG